MLFLYVTNVMFNLTSLKDKVRGLTVFNLTSLRQLHLDILRVDENYSHLEPDQ